MKKYIIFGLMFLITTISVLSFNASLESRSIRPTETLVLDIETTTNPEKGDAYTVEWYDNATNLLDTDTGFLSNNIGGVETEIYVTESNDNWTNAYVNVTVLGQPIQQIFYNVTGSPGNAIIIENCFYSPSAFVGTPFAVDCEVNDVNGNALNNAKCSIFGTDSNDAPIQTCGSNGITSYNGKITCDAILDNLFDEGSNYLNKIRCNCGTGINACFDLDGNNYTYYSGEAINLFTVSTWLKVNTIVDKEEYESRQVASICANVTNVDGTGREPLEIDYQIRCGANDDDTDRIVISANRLIEPDQRGIGFNQTQNQCWGLIVPEKRWLQGRVNTCYASTDVHILNRQDERIQSYHTTSPVFNITIEDLGINPDWTITGDNNEMLFTHINLSDMKYQDYQGMFKGNVDVRLDLPTPETTDPYSDSSEDGILIFDNLYDVQNIKNITAIHCNGTVISHNLENTNEGFIEIELPNVNQSSGCVNVSVEMHIYRDREVEAQEGILDKLLNFLGWIKVQ